MGATLLKILGDEQNPEMYLDEETCRVYEDPTGGHYLRTLTPMDNGVLLSGSGQAGNPQPRMLRHQSGRPANVQDLVLAANQHDSQCRANVIGKPVKFSSRDERDRIVTMTAKPTPTLFDLGVSDVHQPSTLPIYAAGYRICQDGIADAMSPVIMVPKQSDFYGTWNITSDFSLPMYNAVAAGAQVAETNPGLAFAKYSTINYALAGAIPTEVIANADAPFRPFPKLMQVLVDRLRTMRNVRVASVMENSSNWNGAQVQTILSGAQWNEGPASNPVLVFHNAENASYMPINGFGMSGQLWRAMIRNSAFQKFFTYKDGVDAIPNKDIVSKDFKLPMFYVDETKYIVGGDTVAPTFVWGNDVVGIHQPGEMPPTSQMDVATSVTYRWVGGEAPQVPLEEQSLTGGFLVRSYFDPRRGPRGSTVVVCAHWDIELMTSGFVGSLIANAYQ